MRPGRLQTGYASIAQHAHLHQRCCIRGRDVFQMEKCVFSYKLFGSVAGDAGLLFHSCVPHLQDRPELWADECPYIIPRVGRVEVRRVLRSGLCAATVIHIHAAEHLEDVPC